MLHIEMIHMFAVDYAADYMVTVTHYTTLVMMMIIIDITTIRHYAIIGQSVRHTISLPPY